MHDSLRRNSIFLMANATVIAFFGFIFWALAAHFYSTKNVGVAATLVTASTLVATLSMFGFDSAFIRFLPKTKRFADYLNTGFAISTLVTIIVSIIYLIVIKSTVPKLNFLDSSVLWIGSFILFMIVNMLNNLTNFAFIAFRVAQLVFVVNVGFGVARLIALVTLAHFGLNGLVLAHVMATTVALLFTIVLMKKYLSYTFKLNIIRKAARSMAKYALGNYLATTFLTLPVLVVPTIVISRVGAEAAAYYYIVSVIISMLNVIPSATAQSMFAEGSWDKKEIKSHLHKAIKIIIPLITPAILILIVLGKIILTIFGKNYATQGYTLLVLLSVAAIPRIASYLFSTILRIEHSISTIVITFAIYSAIIIIGSLWGLSHHSNLQIIGWVTLLAEVIAATIYYVSYRRLDLGNNS